LNGRELWISGGAETGNKRVKDTNPGLRVGWNPHNLIAVNTNVFLARMTVPMAASRGKAMVPRRHG
jgi:ELWxxDGT repeat protein